MDAYIQRAVWLEVSFGGHLKCRHSDFTVPRPRLRQVQIVLAQTYSTNYSAIFRAHCHISVSASLEIKRSSFLTTLIQVISYNVKLSLYMYVFIC
jgi:hypothetical protein